jgi:hypothetical protein
MFGLFKKKSPTVMDALVRTIYGANPPPKSADLQVSTYIAYKELLLEKISSFAVRECAAKLLDGPVPYSTHDLAVSVALNFFKDPKLHNHLQDAQLDARRQVRNWAGEGKVVGPLADSFEAVLCKRYYGTERLLTKLCADMSSPDVLKGLAKSANSNLRRLVFDVDIKDDLLKRALAAFFLVSFAATNLLKGITDKGIAIKNSDVVVAEAMIFAWVVLVCLQYKDRTGDDMTAGKFRSMLGTAPPEEDEAAFQEALKIVCRMIEKATGWNVRPLVQLRLQNYSALIEKEHDNEFVKVTRCAVAKNTIEEPDLVGMDLDRNISVVVSDAMRKAFPAYYETYKSTVNAFPTQTARAPGATDHDDRGFKNTFGKSYGTDHLLKTGWLSYFASVFPPGAKDVPKVGTVGYWYIESSWYAGVMMSFENIRNLRETCSSTDNVGAAEAIIWGSVDRLWKEFHGEGEEDDEAIRLNERKTAFAAGCWFINTAVVSMAKDPDRNKFRQNLMAINNELADYAEKMKRN